MTRTRTANKTAEPAPAPAPAAKKTTKRAPAKPRTPRARTHKTTGPALSLVKTRPALPTRDKPFMTDVQGYATLAARIAGITTPRITQWTDHQDGTATRPLRDGTLHYNHTTRTLSWQATCLMGAVHTYPIPTPAAAAAARVLAARCTQPHADLIGDAITETIPVPLPHPERALGDQLTHSGADATDTQPLSAQEIAEGLAARQAADTPKEHPQP